MLSRLPISLAQLKAGNNSEKLKNEIRHLLHSLYKSKNLQNIFTKVWLTLFKEGNRWNSENTKTNEPRRFRLDTALANLSIYYTWKNIKSEYNNNKFKIFAPT